MRANLSKSLPSGQRPVYDCPTQMADLWHRCVASMYKGCSVPAMSWLLYLLLLPSTLSAQPFLAERLNGGEPILSARHFQAVSAPTREGDNINGPSVIRIPDWLPPARRAAPTARHYMYFAHHSGDYIRLAWASDIEGPWQLYRTGADVAAGKRGVLDMGSDRRIALGNGLAIASHIASPDVHVDDAGQRIVMYFHGVTRRDGTQFRLQQTYVATSSTGLDFSAGIVPFPLGASYMRVFEINGQLQGLTPRKFYRPRDHATPWQLSDDIAAVESGLWKSHETRFLAIPEEQQTPGHTLVIRPRHIALHRPGNRLQVFYTMKGHSPERILVTSVDLVADDWYRSAALEMPAEVLRAEREWEGGALAPLPSKRGAARQRENALRDPYVFSDEGRLYLFYVGGGEQAIGLARLTPQPAGK
jgi:hypothetical protein